MNTKIYIYPSTVSAKDPELTPPILLGISNGGIVQAISLKPIPVPGCLVIHPITHERFCNIKSEGDFVAVYTDPKMGVVFANKNSPYLQLVAQIDDQNGLGMILTYLGQAQWIGKRIQEALRGDLPGTAVEAEIWSKSPLASFLGFGKPGILPIHPTTRYTSEPNTPFSFQQYVDPAAIIARLDAEGRGPSHEECQALSANGCLWDVDEKKWLLPHQVAEKTNTPADNFKEHIVFLGVASAGACKAVVWRFFDDGRSGGLAVKECSQEDIGKCRGYMAPVALGSYSAIFVNTAIIPNPTRVRRHADCIYIATPPSMLSGEEVVGRVDLVRLIAPDDRDYSLLSRVYEALRVGNQRYNELLASIYNNTILAGILIRLGLIPVQPPLILHNNTSRQPATMWTPNAGIYNPVHMGNPISTPIQWAMNMNSTAEDARAISEEVAQKMREAEPSVSPNEGSSPVRPSGESPQLRLNTDSRAPIHVSLAEVVMIAVRIGDEEKLVSDIVAYMNEDHDGGDDDRPSVMLELYWARGGVVTTTVPFYLSDRTLSGIANKAEGRDNKNTTVRHPILLDVRKRIQFSQGFSIMGGERLAAGWVLEKIVDNLTGKELPIEAPLEGWKVDMTTDTNGDIPRPVIGLAKDASFIPIISLDFRYADLIDDIGRLLCLARMSASR